MNMSTGVKPRDLLEQMGRAAKARFSTDAEWARAAGLPKGPLSRLRNQSSCDLRTLAVLAKSVGCTLVAVSTPAQLGEHAPKRFDRDYEDRLLDLAASGELDPDVWRAHGPGFFMGGL